MRATPSSDRIIHADKPWPSDWQPAGTGIAADAAGHRQSGRSDGGLCPPGAARRATAALTFQASRLY